RLCDADSGKPMSGIVRIFPQGETKPLSLPGLLRRSTGVNTSISAAGWSIVPAGGAQLALPRNKLRLEALSGLETDFARQDVDLSPGDKEITMRLAVLFRPERSDLVAGNTHLHLRGLTLAEADGYLRQVPAADGLKVVFISHLERAE